MARFELFDAVLYELDFTGEINAAVNFCAVVVFRPARPGINLAFKLIT